MLRCAIKAGRDLPFPRVSGAVGKGDGGVPAPLQTVARRGSAAAGAALQAEIATLQDTLTAARDVGKAAIAAFRIEAAAPIKPVEPSGWRETIMRYFGAPASF